MISTTFFFFFFEAFTALTQMYSCNVKLQGAGVKLPFRCHQLVLRDRYSSNFLVPARAIETDSTTSLISCPSLAALRGKNYTLATSPKLSSCYPKSYVIFIFILFHIKNTFFMISKRWVIQFNPEFVILRAKRFSVSFNSNQSFTKCGKWGLERLYALLMSIWK